MTAKRRAICLVCWDAERGAGLAKDLGRSGFRVTLVSESVKGWITYFRDLGVDAVVIDLDRLPSHGREIGILLRGSKSTRNMPLVFAGGVPEKVARAQTEMPDAIFTPWEGAAVATAEAIRKPARTPLQEAVQPRQMMQRAAGHDLGRKLGVKPDMPVVVSGDGEFLNELLGDGVPLFKKAHGQMAHLCLCLTRSLGDVDAAFEMVTAYPAGTLVWIIHPKQAGQIKTDFNQNDVRAVGLALGWVDFKVCAVDANWSGLAFARRKGKVLPRRSLHPQMMKARPRG